MSSLYVVITKEEGVDDFSVWFTPDTNNVNAGSSERGTAKQITKAVKNEGFLGLPKNWQEEIVKTNQLIYQM